jgi:SET domain-containing protein
MKLEVFDGYPRLCLYSKRDIVPGEEIRYDYGDLSQNMFWREKVMYFNYRTKSWSLNLLPKTYLAMHY